MVTRAVVLLVIVTQRQWFTSDQHIYCSCYHRWSRGW